MCTNTQQTHPVGDAALFFQAKKKKSAAYGICFEQLYIGCISLNTKP